MSTCNTGSTVCTPCGYNGVPDAANESVESTLANFIDAFFGSLTKTVVDGEVVWTLPCDLDTGIEGYPRNEGEGVACYLLRVMEEILADAGDVPSGRQILTQHSLTGGGDLTADRTLNLVNDSAAPGNEKYYGTDAGGVKGYHALPAAPAVTGTTVVFATTGTTSVSDATLAETTLLGSVRAGESKTIDADTIESGTVYKFEARGRFTSADDSWSGSILRFKLGSSLTLTFTLAEAGALTPTNYLWDLSVYVTVTTAGVAAATVSTGRLDIEYRDGSDAVFNYIEGAVSGTLDTTAANTVNLTWDNEAPGEVTASCRHAILTQY